MNTIVKIIEEFTSDIVLIENSDFKDYKKNAKATKLCLDTLQKMRLLLRAHQFPSKESEITFFKTQKPYVHAYLMYFTSMNNFYCDFPKSGDTIKRKFINSKIKKLETKKNKHLEFYRNYTNEDTSLDHIYYTRGNAQLKIFHKEQNYDTDPEFNTSHDYKAAIVLAYPLMASFYTQELNKLKVSENQNSNNDSRPAILKNFKWTGTKTELVELINGLIAVGVINNGKAELKQIVKVYEYLFDIDLGNFYKTYIEIKARNKDQTKFLDKLKVSLIQKINSENEIR